MNLYQLAENLHTPLYELRARMTAAEFAGWIKFYQQRDEKPSAPSMLDDPSLMLKGFGL
jgi:hypothetical protein